MDYKTCTLDEILEDAQGNKEKIAYLKSLKNETRKVGKDKLPLTFLTVKRRYFEKFYPEDLPKKPEAKKTMWERIEEL